MTIEISKLLSKPLKHKFERNGAILNLEINRHSVTPLFLLEMREKLRSKEITKLDSEATDADFFCRSLSSVITSWDLVKNGKPVKPTYKFLLTLPLSLVIELNDFCFDVILPK